MQKRIWLVALVAVVLLSGGAAWADDGFYVIGGGGGGVGTKITSLPYTITTPGFYYLGRNLEHSGDGDAILIYADNVTLDLMGCSLTYTGASSFADGISMITRKNVEIRNGTISGFYISVHEVTYGLANQRVINIRANYNTHVGIALSGNNSLVRDCTASNNSGGGIYVYSGTITGCVAADNGGSGVAMTGPGSLLDNIATNTTTTGTTGFSIGSATKILVDGNSAAGNGTNYTAGGAGTVWGVNAGR
ncbi:MAG: right-handed parallel beta-helix repeat-containing protein [Desulfobacterales bacterium]|nr:right-handed parallel beta-helix repeat-containing protein [Pseudomonadota bacterium]MBU4356672.1 right-handed parallel beta-helix repeat-containing protein [Pseudomonadota bacterium]MCG2773980.1 right-handed parallel beta-helix repeat-containing protein [Desulfobacterales bacterium]